jgi:hypothetical protein
MVWGNDNWSQKAEEAERKKKIIDAEKEKQEKIILEKMKETDLLFVTEFLVGKEDLKNPFKQVKGCGVPACPDCDKHTTTGHQCSTCHEYGHGKEQCQNNDAIESLPIRPLPSHLQCQQEGCPYPEEHVTAYCVCTKCRFNGIEAHHVNEFCKDPVIQYIQMVSQGIYPPLLSHCVACAMPKKNPKHKCWTYAKTLRQFDNKCAICFSSHHMSKHQCQKCGTLGHPETSHVRNMQVNSWWLIKLNDGIGYIVCYVRNGTFGMAFLPLADDHYPMFIDQKRYRVAFLLETVRYCHFVGKMDSIDPKDEELKYFVSWYGNSQ